MASCIVQPERPGPWRAAATCRPYRLCRGCGTEYFFDIVQIEFPVRKPSDLDELANVVVNKWTDLLPSGSGVAARGLLSGSAGGVCDRGAGMDLAISSADLRRNK